MLGRLDGAGPLDQGSSGASSASDETNETASPRRCASGAVADVAPIDMAQHDIFKAAGGGDCGLHAYHRDNGREVGREERRRLVRATRSVSCCADALVRLYLSYLLSSLSPLSHGGSDGGDEVGVVLR